MISGEHASPPASRSRHRGTRPRHPWLVRLNVADLAQCVTMGQPGAEESGLYPGGLDREPTATIRV